MKKIIWYKTWIVVVRFFRIFLWGSDTHHFKMYDSPFACYLYLKLKWIAISFQYFIFSLRLNLYFLTYLPIFIKFVSFQNFFEGVEDCIASGVKMEDVGYQIAYNRQELKNIIKEYTAKEVKIKYLIYNKV